MTILETPFFSYLLDLDAPNKPRVGFHPFALMWDLEMSSSLSFSPVVWPGKPCGLRSDRCCDWRCGCVENLLTRCCSKMMRFAE